MTEEKAKMSTGKKLVIVLICVLLLLSAAAYVIGVRYFTRHFLPGSQVNGFNCSYMTAQEAEDLLTRKAESYVLTIETRGNGQESITAQQVGLTALTGAFRKRLSSRIASHGFLRLVSTKFMN